MEKALTSCPTVDQYCPSVERDPTMPRAPHWRVFGKRTLYDSPWMRLVKVDVQPPDGNRFEHHVLRLQQVVLALPLRAAGTGVLMLRRHRFVTDQIGWELPGGDSRCRRGLRGDCRP